MLNPTLHFTEKQKQTNKKPCKNRSSLLKVPNYLLAVWGAGLPRCLLCVYHSTILCWGSPGGSDGKETACNAGDPGSIPGSGRSPGEENGYPLQESCLENPMDRGADGLQSRGHKESDATEQLTLSFSFYAVLRGSNECDQEPLPTAWSASLAWAQTLTTPCTEWKPCLLEQSTHPQIFSCV